MPKVYHISRPQQLCLSRSNVYRPNVGIVYCVHAKITIPTKKILQDRTQQQRIAERPRPQFNSTDIETLINTTASPGQHTGIFHGFKNNPSQRDNDLIDLMMSLYLLMINKEHASTKYPHRSIMHASSHRRHYYIHQSSSITLDLDNSRHYRMGIVGTYLFAKQMRSAVIYLID